MLKCGCTCNQSWNTKFYSVQSTFLLNYYWNASKALETVVIEKKTVLIYYLYSNSSINILLHQEPMNGIFWTYILFCVFLLFYVFSPISLWFRSLCFLFQHQYLLFQIDHVPNFDQLAPKCVKIIAKLTM